MKSVQLSELGPVAEERVHDLAAQGLIRQGNGEVWPADFFTRPLAKADGSVLEQLLADRDEA
jgi:hypothetical protein